MDQDYIPQPETAPEEEKKEQPSVED